MDRLRRIYRKAMRCVWAYDLAEMLQGAAVLIAFFALAGTAGAVDMDTVGADTLISAAVLLGISFLLWHIPRRMSRRGSRDRRRGI